jgi:hypothetical protein
LNTFVYILNIRKKRKTAHRDKSPLTCNRVTGSSSALGGRVMTELSIIEIPYGLATGE